MFRKLKNTVRVELWKKLNVRWVLNSGLEVVVENDNDWYVFNEIFTNGEYDPVFSHVKVKEARLNIVDLGANVGYFSIRIADYLIQAGNRDFSLFSFEAASGNFVALKKRLGQKGLQDKTVLVEGLVGKKEGSSILTTDTDHFGFKVESEAADGKRISYVDVDRYLGECAVIDVLKCDIEGSEQDFIENYPDILRRTELAVFEFHATVCDVNRCRELIGQCGLSYVTTLRQNDVYKTSVEVFIRKSAV